MSTTRIALIAVGVLAAVFVLERRRRSKKPSRRAAAPEVSSRRIVGYVGADAAAA
jgi:hypothetical protein